MRNAKHFRMDTFLIRRMRLQSFVSTHGSPADRSTPPYTDREVSCCSCSGVLASSFLRTLFRTVILRARTPLVPYLIELISDLAASAKRVGIKQAFYLRSLGCGAGHLHTSHVYLSPVFHPRIHYDHHT